MVLDVAHNPHAVRALAANLQAHGGFRRTLAVFAMLADKDIEAVVAAVKSEIDGWFIASLDLARGASATALAALVVAQDPAKSVHLFATPVEAYRAAYGVASEDDRILVFGSFHTVAAVMASRDGDIRK